MYALCISYGNSIVFLSLHITHNIVDEHQTKIIRIFREKKNMQINLVKFNYINYADGSCLHYIYKKKHTHTKLYLYWSIVEMKSENNNGVEKTTKCIFMVDIIKDQPTRQFLGKREIWQHTKNQYVRPRPILYICSFSSFFIYLTYISLYLFNLMSNKVFSLTV